MISLNKLVSLRRSGFQDSRPQLGDPATRFTRSGEDGRMGCGMLCRFCSSRLVKGSKRARFHLIALREHKVVTYRSSVEHAHHFTVDLLQAVTRVDQDESPF